MSRTTLEPPPIGNDLINSVKDPTMAEPWVNWLTLQLTPSLESAAKQLASVNLVGQNAAIGLTALIPVTNAGLYRISYYLKIVVVDAVSSSVTLSITSTDDAVTITQSSAAVTGNTTATVLSGTIDVLADGATPISYSTAYASNTPNVMQYKLSIRVEAL